MKDVSTLVSGIEYKIGKLLNQQKLLIRENQELKDQMTTQLHLIEKQKEDIKQLEEKHKILKLAKTLETTEGNVEAKKKINELVREIDKCIGLLNT
jgi:hypothetical protein